MLHREIQDVVNLTPQLALVVRQPNARLDNPRTGC